MYYLAVLEVRTPKQVVRLHSFWRLKGKSISQPLCGVLEPPACLGCGPFVHLQSQHLFISLSLLSLQCSLSDHSWERMPVIRRDPPGYSRLISPCQFNTLNHICKVLFSTSGFMFIGSRVRAWTSLGTIILPTTEMHSLFSPGKPIYSFIYS